VGSLPDAKGVAYDQTGILAVSGGNPSLARLNSDRALWQRTDSLPGGLLAVDAAGNIYVATVFTKTTLGGKSFASAGQGDLLFMKVTSAGSLAWAVQLGAIGYAMAYALVADAGALYIGGVSATLDAANVPSEHRGFLLKLAADDGRQLWSKTFTASSGRVFSAITGLAVDQRGDLVACLLSDGRLDLGTAPFLTGGRHAGLVRFAAADGAAMAWRPLRWVFTELALHSSGDVIMTGDRQLGRLPPP
jgi:outer membrane protein assembly factor BamB